MRGKEGNTTSPLKFLPLYFVKDNSFLKVGEGPFKYTIMQILTLGRDTWTFASPDPGALFKDF